MRTTVDLPDELFRKMKAAAALRGLSLKQFLTGAVETEIAKPRHGKRRRVRLPLIRSKNPGTLNLTNAEIEDLLA